MAGSDISGWPAAPIEALAPPDPGARVLEISEAQVAVLSQTVLNWRFDHNLGCEDCAPWDYDEEVDMALDLLERLMPFAKALISASETPSSD